MVSKSLLIYREKDITFKNTQLFYERRTCKRFTWRSTSYEEGGHSRCANRKQKTLYGQKTKIIYVQKTKARKVYPDPKFHSEVVSKFINSITMMEKINSGKNLRRLSKIKSKVTNPLKIFNSAISNVKPNIECRSRRVGGATYRRVEVKLKEPKL